MKKKKKYIVKRDWRKYNEELVMRGYFYINPRFLDTWNDEIKQMNAGKVGEPYLYPESMIKFLAVLSPKYDVRALEGIMRALSKAYYGFPAISYSQINRRINALDLTFPVENNNIVFDDIVGCDGTGIKVSNRGEWMRQKWKIRRGWIKVTMIGNKNGKIIDVSVGIETSKENFAFRKMLKIHHESIGTAYGDGTYYKKWSKKNKYGNRWLCTEVIFSAVKRMEGEYVRATKKKNMFHEAKMKFWVYNRIREATRENCVTF